MIVLIKRSWTWTSFRDTESPWSLWLVFRLKYEITVVFDDRAGPDQSSALGKTLRWRLAFVTVHFTASLHELAHKLSL